MLTLNGVNVEPETAESYRRIDGAYDVKMKLAGTRDDWLQLAEEWSHVGATQAAKILNRYEDPATPANADASQAIDVWDLRKLVQQHEKRYGTNRARPVAKPKASPPVEGPQPNLF